VRSIVDRFLEHSRIYYFENACRPEVFVGSADWLPRNFLRRVELVFPIEDGNLRERVIKDILGTVLADNTKAWILRGDGTYERTRPAAGSKARRSQIEFLAMADAEGSSRPKSIDGKTRFARVRLARSPLRPPA
jgi:polyphosphate kinase